MYLGGGEDRHRVTLRLLHPTCSKQTIGQANGHLDSPKKNLYRRFLQTCLTGITHLCRPVSLKTLDTILRPRSTFLAQTPTSLLQLPLTSSNLDLQPLTSAPSTPLHQDCIVTPSLPLS